MRLTPPSFLGGSPFRPHFWGRGEPHPLSGILGDPAGSLGSKNLPLGQSLLSHVGENTRGTKEGLNSSGNFGGWRLGQHDTWEVLS